MHAKGLLLTLVLVGCSSDIQLDDDGDGSTAVDCPPLAESIRSAWDPAVKDFFSREVGASVKSVVVARTRDCPSDYVYSLDAEFVDSGLRRKWRVYVSKGDGKMVLRHPE